MIINQIIGQFHRKNCNDKQFIDTIKTENKT